MIGNLFPRGKGPLISVLIPTRGRPSHLCKAIDSVYSLAVDKSLIEFILKIDDDDKATIATAEWLEKVIPLKKIVSPRGNGFHDLHLWINEMSRMAAGDWLYVFNDDARMVTQDWDQVLLNLGCTYYWPGMEDVCLLVTPTVNRPFAKEFIALRRKTFELLGHFSLSTHVDNWIYSVMSFVSANLDAPIWVEHYSDKIGDKTREESEKCYETSIDSLNSISAMRERENDVNVLLQYMDSKSRKLRWRDSPNLGEWNIYKDKDERLKTAPVDKDGNVIIYKDNKPDHAIKWEDLKVLWLRRD